MKPSLFQKAVIYLLACSITSCSTLSFALSSFDSDFDTAEAKNKQTWKTISIISGVVLIGGIVGTLIWNSLPRKLTPETVQLGMPRNLFTKRKYGKPLAQGARQDETGAYIERLTYKERGLYTDLYFKDGVLVQMDQYEAEQQKRISNPYNNMFNNQTNSIQVVPAPGIITP